MKLENFKKASELSTKIKNNREYKRMLENRCFIYLERNEIPTFIHDDGIRLVMIDYLSKRIAELEKEFEEL